jgi:hypothetical protein
MHYSEVNMREPLHPHHWVTLAEQKANLRDPETWLKEQAAQIEVEYKEALKKHDAYIAATPTAGRIGTNQRLWRINFSYEQNTASINAAIGIIKHKNSLIDPNYTYYQTLQQFQRISKARKATAPQDETRAFLELAEVKYQNLWGYHELYKPAHPGTKPAVERITEILEYIEAELKQLGDTSTDNPEKPEALKIALDKYGFFNLKKIKEISPAKAENLINKMAVEGRPYTIAMFDYLGFNEHLCINHCESTKYKLFEKLAEILGCNKDTADGLVSALSPKATTSKRKKNSSWKHKEQVQKDYEALK